MVLLSTRGSRTRLQTTFFGWPRMASTTLRLQTTVFDDFRMASTTLSDYGLHVYDFKTFPRCAPFPFINVFLIVFLFAKSLIEHFRAARSQFPFQKPL